MNPRARTAAFVGRSAARGTGLRTAACVVFLVTFLGIGAPAALADNTPTIAGLQATEVGVTTATLSGKVDPRGEAGSGITSWHLDFRPAGEEAWTQINSGTIEAPAAEETGNPVTVTSPFGQFGESQPGGSYEFRIAAENAAGQTTSAPKAFELDAATPPVLATEPATGIGYTKATLHGTLDPEGGNSNPIGSEVFSMEWQLQYREAGVFGPGEGWSFVGNGVIEPPAAAESSPIPVSAEVSEGALQPGKSYEVRLVAYYFWATGFQREAESPAPYESFETEAVAKPLVTIAAPSAVTDSSVHLSGTVNPNAPDENSNLGDEAKAVFATGWHFECTPECPAAGGELTADNAAQPVATDPVNLQPNTTYTVVLRASNRGGEEVAGQIAGQPVTFTTEALPASVRSGPLLPLGESVRLRGLVNSHNEALTECRFEYGETESYGQEIDCEELPAADNKEHEVGAYPPALTPGTEYHFRLVADNGAGAEEGEDVTFVAPVDPSEQSCPNKGRPGVGFLPDCRAYEMASSPDKAGGAVLAAIGRVRPSTAGDAVGYPSFRGFGDDVAGSGVTFDYMAQRSSDPSPGANGWSTHAITPVQSTVPVNVVGGGIDPRYIGEYSADLDQGIFIASSPLSADPNVADVSNLYRRTDLRTPGAGTYELLTGCSLCDQTASALPPLPKTPSSITPLIPKLAGAAPDFSHIAFESPYDLTSDAAPVQSSSCAYDDSIFGGFIPFVFFCRPRLYEWSQGTLRLAGRVPADPQTEIVCNDDSGPPCVGADASIAGHGARNNWLTPHVVSNGSDGHSRVFFTQPTNNEGDTSSQVGFPGEIQIIRAVSGRIFMREDHNSTAQLNASERTDCADDPSCGGDNEPDSAPDTFGPAEYLDATPDGTRIYFMTGEQLTDDAPDNGDNIYMYDATKPASAPDNLTLLTVDAFPADGVGPAGLVGTSRDGRYVYFITRNRLTNGSSPGSAWIYLWHDGSISEVGPVSPVDGGLLRNLTSAPGVYLEPRQARVTPDGRHMLFVSRSGLGLGGYDHGSCAFGCRELYVYSADAGQVACATCSPGGVAATADAEAVALDYLGGGNWHDTYALSDDGAHVFFTTRERLLSEDTNGLTRDAYEYNTRTGVLSLLSSGTSPDDSVFMDASPDGKNAFFTTRERLVGWDTDDAYDLYDARVNGGFPEPLPVTDGCSGESCRPAATLSPAVAPAVSATLSGPGNKPTPRCPKGKRRIKARHGGFRCVKRSHKHGKRTNRNRRAGR